MRSRRHGTGEPLVGVNVSESKGILAGTCYRPPAGKLSVFRNFLTGLGKIPLSISDHDLVLCVRKINALKYPPKTIECRDYRYYSPKDFCESLSQINWDPVRYASNVNNIFDFFNVNFKVQCDRHAPSIQKKSGMLTTHS
ncbi:unnamed protein product [Pocillopora meandrina]|uniref:Uncharacterized protein n=1 Tax=Pocillopora meandrina TaxID=46732 RepID=A0AAU9VV23_9CNID|nr:unnamed protein product [Pocillopora meandrina]